MNPSPDFIFKQAAGDQTPLAKDARVAPGPLQEGEPGQPKCRDRSPVAPILLQLPNEVAK